MIEYERNHRINTNMTDSAHQPEPNFVASLEAGLRFTSRASALRALPCDDTTVPATPGSRSTHTRRNRMFATLALMAVSMMLGASGTFAVVKQDQGPPKDLLIMKAQINLERAEIRLQQAAEAYEVTQKLVEQQFVSSAEAEQDRQVIVEAQAEIDRRRIDIEEIEATGRPVDDSFTAPAINGRDFVAERMRTRIASTEMIVQAARSALKDTEALYEAAFVSDQDLQDSRLKVEQAMAALDHLMERIKLRRDFVNGSLSAEQVELRVLLHEARRAVRDAEHQVQRCRSSYDTQQKLHARNFVSTQELGKARAALQDADAQLRLALLELQMIESRIEALDKKQRR